MSFMHAPRAPWIMLAVFSATALVLFFMIAGPDLGSIGDSRPAEEIAAIRREVRMPIVVEKYEIAKEKVAEEVKKELHRFHLGQMTAPTPGETPHSEVAGITGDAAGPVVPEARQVIPDVGAGTLLSHSFKLTDAGFESIFHTDRPVSRSTFFFKSSPAIWVVDLPGAWINRSRRVNTIDQGPIEKVIIGEHETFLRVVFRYRDRNQAQPAQAPEVIEEENGFHVVIPAPPRGADKR